MMCGVSMVVHFTSAGSVNDRRATSTPRAVCTETVYRSVLQKLGFSLPQRKTSPPRMRLRVATLIYLHVDDSFVAATSEPL